MTEHTPGLREEIHHLRRVNADLLAACEKLLSRVVGDAESLDIYVDNWPDVKMARGAIARARGEATDDTL